MRLLDYQETLVFYDGPQLFIAKDQLGAAHICLLVKQEEEADTYLCVPASHTRIHALVEGTIDLREVFSSPEVPELSTIVSKRGVLIGLPATPIVQEQIPPKWFPEPGFILAIPAIPDIQLIKEAAARKRAVIHCSLNPPEASEESKITAEHLAQAVKLVQRVVMHAYKRAIRGVVVSTKELTQPVNYELEVFAFSPGSFTLHMQSSTLADLIGNVPISRAFKIMDSITDLVDDPEKALPKVAEIGGHFASAYKDLLYFITDNNTSLQYEWTMPELPSTIKRRISTSAAKPLYDALTARVDIGREEKRLVGKLTKVDEKLKTWRLTSSKEPGEYQGSSEVDLAGLIIETQAYEFICEERLEEERGTGREITKLYLKSFRSL